MSRTDLIPISQDDIEIMPTEMESNDVVLMENIEQMVATADARITAINKVRDVIFSKCTPETDFVVFKQEKQDANGVKRQVFIARPTRDLARKVASYFGGRIEFLRDDDGKRIDGSETIWVDDIRGNYFKKTVGLSYTCKWGYVESIKTITSRQPFFAKAYGKDRDISEISETDLANMAYTEAFKTCVFSLSGVSAMPADDLKELGVDVTKASGYEFTTKGDKDKPKPDKKHPKQDKAPTPDADTLPGGATPQEAIYGTLMIACDQNIDDANRMLITLTTYPDKETGEEKHWNDGLEGLDKMPENWAWRLLKKIQKDGASSYKKWVKLQEQG